MNTITSTLVCVAYAIAPRRDEELMECWHTLLLIRSCGQLRVFNGAQLRHKIYLVERDLSSDRILDVLHATVRARATLNRQLAKV